MKKRILIGLLALMCLFGCASAGAGGIPVPMPPQLLGQSFVFDELVAGTGTDLWTLVFADDSYRLYNSGEKGLLKSGKAQVFVDRGLWLEDNGEGFGGSWRGSAFEAPSVTLTLEGVEMKFTPASENSEYVYLAQLGVYEGRIGGETAILILERWHEYYLYAGGGLSRGSYEIHADGRIVLTGDGGESVEGSSEGDGFVLPGAESAFVPAGKLAEYAATHAMGDYTLSLYGADVFAIHGADGLVKAIGTVETDADGGRAVYFPRKVTGDVETGEAYTVEFERSGDSLLFPPTTSLLPRSGNVSEKTGLGSYWVAGTTMEFVLKTDEPSRLTVEYQPRSEAWSPEDIPLEATSGESGLLRQSMPSLGTARPLTLLIDFPDQCRPRFIAAEDIERAMFSLEEEDSLSAFYFRSSYGNLVIDGTVLDWYRAEKQRGQYDSDKEIIREALEYHMRENGLKLSDYDADGDGEVDSLYVLWAGDMDGSSHMWSSAYRSSWSASPKEWDAAVRGYIFVPGATVWSAVPPLKCNVNSLTHETGHLLGLNDYYSYDTSDRTDDATVYTGGALEGGLGGMDMMDVNMGDHNAFSKWLLGWLEPEVVEYADIAGLAQEERVFTLRPSNEAPDALFIRLTDTEDVFAEYLVVEVVSSTMNAGEFTRLKEPVVRVLHVDASTDSEGLTGNWRAYGFKNDNSYTTTKFISIVEADGRDTVLNHLPSIMKLSYDVDDYFTAGDTLGPATYPSTNGYDAFGNATVYNGLTVTVESISPDGETVIRLGYEEKPDALTVTGVSPEPVIVPCAAEDFPAAAAGTERIEIAFDREISVDGERIRVASGNILIGGWQASAEGGTLVITFDGGMKEGCGYTVIVPHGAVVSAQSAEITNGNLIFGFATE